MTDQTSSRSRKVAKGAALAAVVVGLGLAGLRLGPATAGADTEETAQTATAPVATDTVVRTTLTESRSVRAQVSYGDAWNLPVTVSGVVTQSHPVGTVVRPGDPVVWVNNAPVTLVKGDTPMYRTLAYERGADRKLMNGDDVRQLQEFLVSKGFDDKGRLTADGEFGLATRRAVQAWQKETGRPVTGQVDRSQIVMAPDAVRINAELRVGSEFTELPVTASDQTVTATGDNKLAPFLVEGQQVTIDPGSGDTITGRITSVESTLDADGNRALKATISVDQRLADSVREAQVTVVREMATDVLAVPVRAILALAGSGYGLEVQTTSGTQVRPIELGAVVGDQAEVSGDIAEGDTVVVPRSVLGEDS